MRIKVVSRLLIVLVIAALLIPAAGHIHAQGNGGFPRTVTDGAGNSVTINAKPVHIVSVTLGTDEILLSLVDPARIAAVTANALDPEQSNVVEQAKHIPAQLATADPETIIALKPDLVFVASYTDAGIIKQFKDAKLTVFVLGNFSSIKDIENNITLLGTVVGEETQAAKIVGAMEDKLNTVANAVKGQKPLRVLFYLPDGYTDGAGSTVDGVITHAGGINVITAAGIKDTYTQVNDEFVVQQDPDVILIAGLTQYSPGFADKFYNNPNFQTLKAVKNKRAVVVDDAHLDAVSQYIADGVSDVAALLYPDAYHPAATQVATLNATMAATTMP
jgi:iron complex transport system substrate-binding protein